MMIFGRQLGAAAWRRPTLASILTGMERDTAPAVAARYDSMIGALSGARKLELAAQLTQGTRAMAEAGLRSRHPAANDEEIRCRFAELLYGRAIAERLFGRAFAEQIFGAAAEDV